MRKFKQCKKTRLLLVVGTIMVFFSTFLPSTTYASTIIQDKISIEKAQVLKIEKTTEELLPSTDSMASRQTLNVLVLDGVDKGRNITFDNDAITQLKVGDTFYLEKTVNGEDHQIVYVFYSPDRIGIILAFAALFGLLVILFGGKQGVRGLVSLIGSFVLILYVLLPGILHGYSPVFVSIAVASLIIIVGSYVTHGFNKTTTSAVLGMIATVIVTGILAQIAIRATNLTGFDTEEAVYLNANTRGHLDFVGLLLGGMIIGILGVLYDAAIGQAVSVEELYRIAPHVSRWKIFSRAIRIGREHIGALVNTLAIAYVGISLPLLLLFSTENSATFIQLINRENFATEIIRILIGSSGLVLAVPVTTLLAIFILIKKAPAIQDHSVIKKEENLIEHAGHHHG